MRFLSCLLLLIATLHATEVKSTSTSTGTIHRWITIPAHLEPSQQTLLHAKVAGFLKSIAVDVGDDLKAGECYASLDVPELDADHIKALAELDVATQDLSRLQSARSQAPGLVLPLTLDQAVARQRMAEASLKRIDILRNEAILKAPFSGTVTERHADLGKFIPAGGSSPATATITLADLSCLCARVPVPEQDAPFIKTGTLARVLSKNSPIPTMAKVTRHGRSIETPSATLPVEVDIPNPDGKWLAGSYVKVQLAAETHTNALLIPCSTILTEKSSSSVFILKQGKACKTKVTLGFNDSSNAEVLSGLSGGEPLAILTGITLTDGQSVSTSSN